MSTPKHLTWERDSNGFYNSQDSAFQIVKMTGAQILEGHKKWHLFIGQQKNVSAGEFHLLYEAKRHAQFMRDAGNA